MAAQTQKELANLAKLYLAARNRLLNTIVNFKGVGTKVYANSVLQHLNRELEAMAKATDEYVDTAIPEEYKKGLDETYAYFKKNNLLMKHPSLFADLHTEAIHAVAREMQFQIQQGLATVGRQILRYVDSARDEVLRAVGLASSGEKIASGSTVIQMKHIMIEKLKNEGFMTVQYGSGVRAFQVPIDTYAMLCARSTTREAGNLARENQLTANGYDLVEMSTHYPTCPVCAQYQGRVYSITGEDRRFPPLSTVFSSGYHNVHPNCRHVIVPWIEELRTDDEVQEAIRGSNAPFKDSRSKREVDLYNEQQAKNRRMREDLYRYERYKARLGEDAPKTFQAFRRLKKTGGEKWDTMQTFYHYKKDVPTLSLEDYRRNLDLETHKESVRDSLPAVLKLGNKSLQTTLNVTHHLVQGVVPKEVELEDVTVIAGKGVRTDVRARHRLTAKYGGLPAEWEKGAAIAKGRHFRYDIHWYQNNSIAPEETYKLKGVKPL